MPPGTLRINDMDFILNGPHVKYKSSSLPKTEKSKFKENTEFQIPKKKNLQVYCYSGFHLIVHTTAFCPPTQRLKCITGLRILPLKVVCKIWNNFLLEKTRLNAPHQKKKHWKQYEYLHIALYDWYCIPRFCLQNKQLIDLQTNKQTRKIRKNPDRFMDISLKF